MLRSVNAGVLIVARWGLAGSAVFAAGVPWTGMALEWRETPEVTVETARDSNIFMQPKGALAVTSTAVTTGASITARDPGFEFHLAPRLSAISYQERPDLDRSNAYADLSVATFDDRQRWSLDRAYARESTLTHEFDGIGIVDVDRERVDTTWSTSWNRMTGARSSYQLLALVKNVDFGHSDNSPYGDYYASYRYNVLQAAYRRVTGERTSWQFSAMQSRLDRADFGASTTLAVHATWTGQLSEVLQTSFGIGYFDVSSDSPLAGVATSSGAALEFSLERAWAFWRLDVNGGRDVRPDGRGFLVRQDDVTARLSRRLTARLDLALSLSEARQETTFSTFLLYDNAYARRGVDLEWRIGRQWRLKGGLYQRSQSAAWLAPSSGMGGTLSATYRGR